MPDAERVHKNELGERCRRGSRERERAARRSPVEGEPHEKSGRKERERDLARRHRPGVVEEGAEREVRRDEGQGAGGERGSAAGSWEKKRRGRSIRGGAKRGLVAQNVQKPRHRVKGPEQQRHQERRVERAGAVPELDGGDVVLQEAESAVDPVERRAEGRAGGKEREEERWERESRSVFFRGNRSVVFSLLGARN